MPCAFDHTATTQPLYYLGSKVPLLWVGYTAGTIYGYLHQKQRRVISFKSYEPANANVNTPEGLAVLI